MADTWNLPFSSTTLDPERLHTDPRGLEAAARDARYAFLCAAARRATQPEQLPIVAVAHHADDQAETMLLRLVQGSGLRGLGAMRPVVEIFADSPSRPVRLVRPLLDARRADIQAYAEYHGLPWREDRSNLDRTHLRNHLRHVLLPALCALNPQVVAGLTHTAALLADDAARLAALDRQLLAELAPEQPTAERVVIALARWPTLGASERRGALRAALDSLGADLRAVGFEHIEELLARLAVPVCSGGPHPLAGGVSWSTAGATAAKPARLSLHCSDRPPLRPPRPG